MPGPFSWLSGVDLLGSLPLTALAQTVSPTDVDQITWPDLAPRVDVDSVRLAYIDASTDYRPVADRREWNQRGRFIPLKTPNLSNVVMTPIESNYGIREEEIQRLREQTLENQAKFQSIVGTKITDQVPKLAAANWRRIEKDFYDAWALGQIVVKDPQGAADETVALGFAAGRYLTPAAWTGGSAGTAYAKLMTSIEDAMELIGSVRAIELRLATFKAIQESAPMGVNAVKLTAAQVKDRVEQDTGRPFDFIVNERSMDVFTDGGTSTVRTKLWPANRVAFIPDGFRIGSTYFAPVARAFDLSPNGPEQSGIDVRGNTVYTEVEDNGRGLVTECQVNALPMPNEQALYVLNVGI